MAIFQHYFHVKAITDLKTEKAVSGINYPSRRAGRKIKFCTNVFFCVS
jgi:hypothetical protein